MTADERRPAEDQAASEEAWLPSLSLPAAADWLAGFDAGRAVGELETSVTAWPAAYAAGRADEAAERDAADAAAAEVAHRRHAAWLASLTPYDELAERRGMPEAAARQRAILAERGIA